MNGTTAGKRLLATFTTATLIMMTVGCITEQRAARSEGGASGGLAQGSLRPGAHEFTVQHGGRTRRYFLHVPRTGVVPRPLVVAFHGGGGNAPGFRDYAELDGVSERHGFLVVYPNGTGPLPNRLLTWNAGDNCCGYARNNNVDDVGFAEAVVRDVARRTPVDSARVYATGHSNGGIMAHRLAAERPGVVAAIASVAGAMDLALFSPTQVVPVLQIHSVDDPRALYDGGLGPPFPGTNSRVLHSPAMAGVDRWVVANGCAEAVDTAEVRVGGAGTRNAGQKAELLVWSGCRSGAEVWHWRLSGVGHGWPGEQPPAGGENLVGRQTTLIRAAEEIWRFFSRFPQ